MLVQNQTAMLTSYTIFYGHYYSHSELFRTRCAFCVPFVFDPGKWSLLKQEYNDIVFMEQYSVSKYFLSQKKNGLIVFLYIQIHSFFYWNNFVYEMSESLTTTSVIIEKSFAALLWVHNKGVNLILLLTIFRNRKLSTKIGQEIGNQFTWLHRRWKMF